MSKPLLLSQLLLELEATMRGCSLWQVIPPSEDAFESNEPFCLNTMGPEEWLQWVFIIKMNLLIQNNLPLPDNLSLSPYFEEVFAAEHHIVLRKIKEIDDLFNI